MGNGWVHFIQRSKHFYYEAETVRWRTNKYHDKNWNFSVDKNSLAVDKILTLKRAGLIPDDIDRILHSLRKKGNKAAHGAYGDEKTAELLLSWQWNLELGFKKYMEQTCHSIQKTIEYKNLKILIMKKISKTRLKELMKYKRIRRY